MGKQSIFLILGNQLFDPARHFPDFDEHGIQSVFMAEDTGLCTHFRYHRQKIVLFLAAMREYAAGLRTLGHEVDYLPLDTERTPPLPFEEKLAQAVERRRADGIVTFEIEDKFFERRIRDFCMKHGLRLTLLASPMFLTTRDRFAQYLRTSKKPFMKTFYEQRRRELGILIDAKGGPEGGQWSFDSENRRKLPDSVAIPRTPTFEPSGATLDVIALVDSRFAHHPGRASEFRHPVRREDALAVLDQFIREKLELFGDYEDALSGRDPFLFHSVLTPALNLGLVTPDEVVERVLAAAKRRRLPLNSVEGFIRQVIGWREFIRGIYQGFSERQDEANFWGHRRRLTSKWYDGTTGIPPLDDAIRKTLRHGYAHHIERLMVLGNLMLLCEVEPREAHRWFMEMFVDSSDWVMGPNVYGMALFSDGGIFATKPYICGSNYLLKMGHFERGEWCDVVDGLYWSFIDAHRDFFERNPRLSMMARTLDRMKPERRGLLFGKAARFRDEVTSDVRTGA